MTLPRQRIAKTIKLGAPRPLTKEDLELLKAPRQNVARTKTLKDSHHRVARLFAIGLRPFEVAAATGYSNQRIHTLTIDPAFKELIAKYRDTVNAEFAREADHFYDIATSNMLKAERQISDKLDAADDEDETLPIRDLIAISRDAADRFGYGKHNTQTNVNVDFASRLEATKLRSAQARQIESSVSAPPQTILRPPQQSPQPVQARPPTPRPAPVPSRILRRA